MKVAQSSLEETSSKKGEVRVRDLYENPCLKAQKLPTIGELEPPEIPDTSSMSHRDYESDIDRDVDSCFEEAFLESTSDSSFEDGPSAPKQPGISNAGNGISKEWRLFTLSDTDISSCTEKSENNESSIRLPSFITLQSYEERVQEALSKLKEYRERRSSNVHN